MSLNDLPRNIEAKAAAAGVAGCRAVDSIEPVKEVRNCLLGNANAMINHSDQDLLVLDLRAHDDLATIWAELDGVAEQVGHHLL